MSSATRFTVVAIGRPLSLLASSWETPSHSVDAKSEHGHKSLERVQGFHSLQNTQTLISPLVYMQIVCGKKSLRAQGCLLIMSHCSVVNTFITGAKL